MSGKTDWKNPYRKREGSWFKGNLHTHTSPASNCGKISIEDSLKLYESKNYDFIALSDHMTVSEYTSRSVVRIPGIEWNASKGEEHTGIYSLDGEMLSRYAKIET